MQTSARKVVEKGQEEDPEPTVKRAKVNWRFLKDYGWMPLVEDNDELAEVGLSLALRFDQEFTIAWTFKPSFIRRLAYHGFLPMSLTTAMGPIMTPKLHMERCVLSWENLRVPKKVKKKCRLFAMTTNTCFERVVDGCNEQHGRSSWLCQELVDSFTSIFTMSRREEEEAPALDTNIEKLACRMHSVEVWMDGELVAGEIGYSVGRCYTSLSGFYNTDSAGTVQCVATAKFLEKAGMKFWDLGMKLAYKIRLGASVWPREKFLQELYEVRDDLSCNLNLEMVNTQDLIIPRSRSPA